MVNIKKLNIKKPNIKKLNLNLKDKKTMLIIGGGVTLAIILSLGVGLGVGLSDSTDTPTNNSIEQQIPKDNNGKDLQEKIDSFLNSGLEENIEVTNELNRLKAELDKETTNIDETRVSIATQIKNHLKNKLPSRLTQVEALIKQIEDNNIEVFDEVGDKLATLRNQKTKLDGMLQSENVGFEFLDGVIDSNSIKETAFVGLTNEVATYVADLTKYKASLTELKTKYEGVSEEVQTKVQTIHDNIVSKSIKISEVLTQVKTLLTTSLAAMITKLTNAIGSITEDEKDKYTDVKPSYDITKSNLEKLNTLNTYITNTNIDTVLKDTAAINTQFTNFAAIVKISGEEVLTRFREVKDDLQQRITTLVKISEGMGDTGFSKAIFDVLTTRVADLATLNTGLTSINGGTLTLDKTLETLGTLENDLYIKILSYKNAGSKFQQIKVSLPANTDPNYLSQKALVDYFANKDKILEDFSTEAGITTFNKNVTDLLKITINQEEIKEIIKEKIGALIAVTLTEDTTIETALNGLKAQLDTDGADVDAIWTEVSNKIKEYLTVHLNALKAKVKEIEDKDEITVFDDVAVKLSELKKKQSSLEALNTNTVGIDILSGETTIGQIAQTVFTPLTKEVATYVADLTKYKTSLTQLIAKYEGISVDVQTSIQTIHDNIVSKSIKISEVITQVKTVLTTSLPSIITKITNVLNSITEDEKETYTDVKSIYDTTKSNLEKLKTLNNYITTANMDTVLKDPSIINTQFANFNSIAKISGEEVLTKFKETQEDVQQRIAILVKIAKGMGELSFSAIIFNILRTREADLKNINDGIASINSKTLTLDAALNTLTTTEDNFIKRLMEYKQIGEKVEKLLTILPLLDKETSNYQEYESLGNYFSNKKTILEGFTTEEGKNQFEANRKRLEALDPSVSLAKTNMGKKIDQLIALELTDSTSLKEALRVFKTELEREDRTIAEMKIKINNRINEYLTSLSTSIKDSIKDAKDRHTDVYPFIVNKINELEASLAIIEALTTKMTSGKDLFKDEITNDEFRETVFTKLTTETINEYARKRGGFNNSINFTRNRLTSTWPEIAAKVKVIEDQFNAKTINVPEASIKLKEILQPLFNSIIEQLTISIESVPEGDRNLYSDVKAAFDKMIANKAKLVESLRKITENFQTTYENLSEVNSMFGEFELQTSKTEKEFVKGFAEKKDLVKDSKLLLGKIKTALRQAWITSVEGFLPTKRTLITDITTHEAITTYVGLLEKLKTLETKIYNEILKYKNTDNKLGVIKTEIDSLASDPTNSIYLKLKAIYDYLKNENEILKDVGTRVGVEKIISNINKINDSSEFNTNLVLKINMEALVANTQTGDTREGLLNAGEFNIFKDTGFYCGGTTQEEANTKLQTSLSAFQESQTYVVKPHSIKADSNFKVTFPKYRNQENVEVDCWEVEVAEDYPTLSKEPLTQEEGYKYAIVRSNINKKVIADGDVPTSGKLIKQMAEDTGVYCEVGFATTVAKVDTYYAQYESLGEANYGGANIKGSFIYKKNDVETTSEDAYCFKLVPKGPPPSINTLAEDVPLLPEEKDDFNTRVNSFKTELEALSTDAPSDETKKETLNYGIYKLALKHGVYCAPGTTTVEEAQISLTALSSKLLSYILFVRPKTTVINSNKDVTFTKFKDEDNKVVKCWDVEVEKPTPGTKAVSGQELTTIVNVHNNIHKAYRLDKTITLEERDKQMKKLYEDTNLGCTTTSSVPSSAEDLVRRLLPNYRLVVSNDEQFLDVQSRGYYLTTFGIYQQGFPNRKSIGLCYRVAPSSIYSFKEAASQPETKGLFNANDIKVNFDTFKVYEMIDNFVQSRTRLNELIIAGKDTKLSHRYQITFKDSRSDVAGKGNIYNIVFRINKKEDGTLIIVIEDAFYRTLSNTATLPSETWDAWLDTNSVGGKKVQISKESIKLSFNFLQTGIISTENVPVNKNIPVEFGSLLDDLIARFEGVSTKVQETIEFIKSNLGDLKINLAIAKEQVTNEIENFINAKIKEYDDLLDLVLEDDKDRYPDLKSEITLINQNRKALVTLKDFITDNRATILDDSTVINTQFANFRTIAGTIGRSAIDNYLSKKDKLASDLALLKKIEAGLETGGFLETIFNTLKVRETTLADIKAKYVIVEAKNQIMDEIIRNTNQLMEGLYANIMKYKEIGTKLAELKIMVEGLEETDETYLEIKALYDYFATQESIITAISTTEGLATLETKITELNTATALDS